MFINQYFISESNKNLKVPLNFKSFEFSEKIVCYHKKLDLTYCKNAEIQIVLLGFILDPYNPKRNNESIVQELSTSNNLEELVNATARFSGRFILLYGSNKKLFALTDYLSERSIYYSDLSNGILTSNPKLALYMLGLKEKIPKHKLSLINDREFLEKFEHWFVDSTDWDERFEKLLPNYYLSLTSLQSIRLPKVFIPSLNYEEVVNKAIEILSGTLEAITSRYDDVILPLTAGYDSRLLLSVSYPFKDYIRYLTFNRQTTYVLRDVKIAEKLAKKFDLNYCSIIPNKLTDHFIEVFPKSLLYHGFYLKYKIFNG